MIQNPRTLLGCVVVDSELTPPFIQFRNAFLDLILSFQTPFCERFVLLRKRKAILSDPQRKGPFLAPKKNFTTSGSVGGFWVFFGAGTEDFSRWVFVAVKIWGNQKLDTFSNLFKKIW